MKASLRDIAAALAEAFMNGTWHVRSHLARVSTSLGTAEALPAPSWIVKARLREIAATLAEAFMNGTWHVQSLLARVSTSLGTAAASRAPSRELSDFLAVHDGELAS